MWRRCPGASAQRIKTQVTYELRGNSKSRAIFPVHRPFLCTLANTQGLTMTKHSKNSKDGAVFTYAERRAMAHGSIRARLSASSLRAWDACALTLSPATTPVLTREGILYDRAALLSALLTQRARTLPTREASPPRSPRVEYTDEPAPAPQLESAKQTARASASSFWVPGATPGCGVRKVDTPKKRARKCCPVTGHPIKMRDVIDLAPTPTHNTSDARFMCPLCRHALTNAQRPVALATGTVLCAR